jgi:hypothetical protein
MNPSDNITQAVKEAIWFEINSKLHTAIPAIVSKYNPDGPTVEAKPIIPKKFNDGTTLNYKPIVEVPVVFPRTNRFHLSFPLEEGDGVLLIFSERSIEAWLKSGKEQDPSNNTKYSLTDAIAIPGLFALNKGSKIEDGKKVELTFDNAKIVTDGTKWDFTAGGSVTPLSGVVTGECTCAFTGLPHPVKSSKFFVEK